MLKYYSNSVAAGFPSPADDHEEAPLNLHSLLVRQPASTFFMRAKTKSMTTVGIFEDDILIIDRSLKPLSGHTVVAIIEGDFKIKCLKKKGETFFLYSADTPNAYLKLTTDVDHLLWGVITYVVHELR